MRENKKNSMRNRIKEVWKKVMVPSLSGAFFAMSHMTTVVYACHDGNNSEKDY